MLTSECNNIKIIYIDDKVNVNDENLYKLISQSEYKKTSRWLVSLKYYNNMQELSQLPRIRKDFGINDIERHLNHFLNIILVENGDKVNCSCQEIK